MIFKVDPSAAQYFYPYWMIAVTFGILIFSYLRKKNVQPMKFICMPTKGNKSIVKSISENIGEYCPPNWYNSHIGCMLPIGEDLDLQYEREMFQSTDEEEFAVDWYPHKPCNFDNHDICILLPGLGLSSGSKFAKKFVEAFAKENYLCAVVITRGLEVPLKSTKLWHPGMYEDAKVLIKSICLQQPASRVHLVGFSAGTHIIMSLLRRLEPVIQRAVVGVVCICISHNYTCARSNLERSLMGSVYSFLVTYMHKEILRRNKHLHEVLGKEVVASLLRVGSASAYDKLACTALYGFESEEAYTTAMSCHSLDHIKVPLLAVQPRDDPLHQGDLHCNINIHEFERNQHTIYFEPQYGNHFGFYEGSIWEMLSNKRCYTYPARLALHFFRCVHKET